MTGTDNERELQWQRHHPDVRGSWQWQWQRGVRNLTLIRLGAEARPQMGVWQDQASN